MKGLLLEISDDANIYLNLKELAMFSTISTATLFRSLNNMIYNRYIPYENSEEILSKLKNKEEVKLSDVRGSSDINYVDYIDKYVNTHLYWATKNDFTEIVELLIKTGKH